MTCVMALVSYSSPERYESKNAFSRRTRSACTDTAWRRSETTRRARWRPSRIPPDRLRRRSRTVPRSGSEGPRWPGRHRRARYPRHWIGLMSNSPASLRGLVYVGEGYIGPRLASTSARPARPRIGKRPSSVPAWSVRGLSTPLG